MKRTEIRVHVVDYGRTFLVMRYRDPVTGKQVAKSAETGNRKQAEKAAAKWEAEIQDGRYKSPSKTTWEEFRHRYEDEVLTSFAVKTYKKASAVFNAVEAHIDPHLLSALDSEAISTLQSRLRESRETGKGIAKPGCAESTIKGYLSHLLAALNWAKDIGMLREVPKVRMPQRAKKSGKAAPMKGRPITGEEFDRMLAAVPKVTGEWAAPSWQRFLRGLWWSGLRLEESLALYWDRDDKLCVDLSGKYPTLRIPGELEKGNTDRVLPIAPEFAEFLLSTPVDQRTGPVFRPGSMQRRGPGTLCADRVGRITTKIGKKAGVKVLADQRTGKVKYASAHDLRRSFGERWAVRVMPQVLMQLMRHESIDTTLRYYVGRNAETTADALYQAMGNTLGNTGASETTEKPVDGGFVMHW